MNAFARRVVVLSCLLIFVSFSGCNPKSAVTNDPDPATHPAVETVKIGAVIPLTGYAGAYGKWIKEALELAKDEANAQGGIQGRKLEIVYEDDAANPTQAANAMQKLATVDKVPVVIGSWASSSVMAQAPIAERTKTIVMALAASPEIRNAGDYVFRAAPDARLPLGKLIPYMLERGDKTMAVFYINNDFGKDQADVFRAEYEKAGGKIVFFEGYDAKSPDFRTSLIKIKEFRPQALFLPGYAEVGKILKQAAEMDLQGIRFYSSFPFENEDILKTAGAAAEGVIYPHFFNPTSGIKEMQDYQTRYQAKYGNPSEGFAAEAYNAMVVILATMREVGFSSAAIKDRLYKAEEIPGLFGKTRIDSYGDIQIPLFLKTVIAGRFVALGRNDNGK